MKKITALLFLFVFMSMSAVAQGNGVGPRRGGGSRMNPAMMAKHRTEMMVKKYNLNEEQAKALAALNEKMIAGADVKPKAENDSVKVEAKKERKSMGDRKNARPGRNNMREGRGRFNFEEYNNALKSILTEEQYNAYESDIKSRMKRSE